MSSRICKAVIVGVVIAVTVLSLITPPYPEDQLLQQSGTVLLLAALFWDIRHDRLWWSSFLGIALFNILHIIGARWIYSFVPYEEWVNTLAGMDLDGMLGLRRNCYDRFVHLVYGILLFPVMLQSVRRWVTARQGTSVFVTWLMVQTGSMFYELFEWVLTLVLSPEAADNFNGQQGDMWDAQKDMAAAMVSSTLTAVACMAVLYHQRHNRKTIRR